MNLYNCFFYIFSEFCVFFDRNSYVDIISWHKKRSTNRTMKNDETTDQMNRYNFISGIIFASGKRLPTNWSYPFLIEINNKNVQSSQNESYRMKLWKFHRIKLLTFQNFILTTNTSNIGRPKIRKYKTFK